MILSRAQVLALGLLVSGVLSGCGFTPLYAEPGVVPALSHIDVETQDDRTGYLLRERLEDALGWKQGEPPLYRLVVTSTETRAALGRRLDDTATRYELNLAVHYVLTDGSGAVMRDTVVNAVTNYAASDQPYAGLVAREDAQDRAAGQGADLIRADLARLFADRAARPIAPRR